ncbi:hypothetical protein F4824DRAFT_311517 [Ustulina deusta]|nr:hypothetical protein F4824DRAFT_311517 [Ustulina deusta]
MLGRLKMSERECMATFEYYCGMIFSHPLYVPWQLGRIMLLQYSGRRLIEATKLVVGEFHRSPEAKKWRCNMFSSPGEHCKTTVLAMAQQKNKRDDILYVFRSFDTNPTTGDAMTSFESCSPRPADDCQIWQVARATSAALTYFPSPQSKSMIVTS